MRTIQELVEELQKFPPDARCFAYEGEGTGIVILRRDGLSGFVSCKQRGPDSDTEMLG